MELNSIVAILTILAGWAGFSEWRIRSMYAQMKEKIEDKERINQVVQGELKNDILRLEGKIDMLIQLQIQEARHAKSS